MKSVKVMVSKNHLTANQAMVLLDIYRGTFCFTRHTGTAEGDLERLKNNGWIKMGLGPEITNAGTALVKEWLA